MGFTVLRRVLRRGSEKGVSRRCLVRPLGECAPLGVCPVLGKKDRKTTKDTRIFPTEPLNLSKGSDKRSKTQGNPRR